MTGGWKEPVEISCHTCFYNFGWMHLSISLSLLQRVFPPELDPCNRCNIFPIRTGNSRLVMSGDCVVLRSSIVAAVVVPPAAACPINPTLTIWSVRCIVCCSLFSLFFLSCTVLVLVTACHCCCPMHWVHCTLLCALWNTPIPCVHLCSATGLQPECHHPPLIFATLTAVCTRATYTSAVQYFEDYSPFLHYFVHPQNLKNMCLNLFPHTFLSSRFETPLRRPATQRMVQFPKRDAV